MRDTTPKAFAERVSAEVARLQKAGLTKAQIAERAGIARSVLDRYEKGGMPDSPGRLADLARAFGVTMDYLWGRVDERTGLYVPPPEIAERIAAIADQAAQLSESLRPTAPGGEQ